MADLLNYLSDNPDASLSDMADAINRSRSTAGSYVSELQSAGRLYKSGHGWEVQDAV
jgi:DNA-binding IclR family transcriptional regulator